MGASSSVPGQASDNCSNCSIKFNKVIKRNKRLCLECQCLVCTTCLQTCTAAPPTPATQRVRRIITGYCQSCVVMISADPTHQQLSQLKVRHLKAFLTRRNVPEVGNCVEKTDLVELILANYGGRTYWADREQQQDRLEELMSRQRVHPSSSDSGTPPLVVTPPENRTLSGESQSSIRSQTDPEIKQPTDSISKISLSEIESENELDTLSVKQLKILLTRNLVDYKGCKEKHELVSKVKMLWHSRQANQRLYEQLLNPPAPDDGTPANHEEPELCKICMDSTIDCVLLNCGHMVACTKCGKQLNECPICRQYVVKAVHIFRA